jgi:hypothetical protein
MPQISVQIKNSTGTDYNVTVADEFGGALREVDGSPFALAAGETSVFFSVNASGSGEGRIRYQCQRGPKRTGIDISNGDVVSIS